MCGGGNPKAMFILLTFALEMALGSFEWINFWLYNKIDAHHYLKILNPKDSNLSHLQ